jgi:sporulation protein YlmC with PRC-barrel domain
MSGQGKVAEIDLDSTQKIFYDLFVKHTMHTLYNDLKPQFDKISNGADDVDYEMIGRIGTNFLLSVVNYKAPNSNSNIKAK